MIYLLVVLVSATTVGLVPAIVASLLAFLAFNFFFVPPLHTLAVSSSQDLVRLLTFLAVAVITSTLATIIDITQRKQSEEQMRQFASQLSLAEQTERQRIAAILHDDLQQRLYALQVRLASAFSWAVRATRRPPRPRSSRCAARCSAPSS